jgi:glycolate oxidase FAD binding subunit
MSSSVPAELTDACADLRLASDQDVVCGQPAKYVAEPASTAEAAALLRAAAALDLSVLPRGSGTRLNWGNPPRTCDLIVSTGRLDEIVEHAAGDLVVIVQAGVRLDALQAQLATKGQRLALDPPQSGTIGGLIATNAAGPLRFRYGAPRDLLIGLTIVRADGVVAKAGGKVVKNVAGYDLGKLFAGSYGTLGLITQATFRLHPLPAASTHVTAETDDIAAAAALILAAALSPVAPAAIELNWPSAAAPLSVSVLLEGDEASVAERVGILEARLRSEADRVASVASETAGSRPAHPKRAGRGPVSLAPGATATLIRAAFWAGRLSEVLSTIRVTAEAHGLDPAVSGSAAAGVLEIDVQGDADAERTAAFVAGLRAAVAKADSDMPTGSVVVLYAPAEVRAAVDVWGPVPSVDLMRAVKDQFDPGHRLAPGRLAGGI